MKLRKLDNVGKEGTISLQLTTRGEWWFVLPCAAIFPITFTYMSLVILNIVPKPAGENTENSTWFIIPGCIGLWLFWGWLLYRVIYPVKYSIEVSADRICFQDSSRPDRDKTISQNDVRRFFINPRGFFHSTDTQKPVVYETHEGDVVVIDTKFVYEDIAKPFFDAIADRWGFGFVPESPKPGLMSTQIRLWPKHKTPP